jgi:hypothetical protein
MTACDNRSCISKTNRNLLKNLYAPKKTLPHGGERRRLLTGSQKPAYQA